MCEFDGTDSPIKHVPPHSSKDSSEPSHLRAPGPVYWPTLARGARGRGALPFTDLHRALYTLAVPRAGAVTRPGVVNYAART